MQEQGVTINLEYIPKEIFISILLSLNLKDLFHLSITSKVLYKFLKEILENTNFDSQLAHKWIEKIKADIMSVPPDFENYKVWQYKKFYVNNNVEQYEPNQLIARKIVNRLSVSSFIDKVKDYSANRFDVQLSRLFANNPGLTKYLYSYHLRSECALTFIRASIDSRFNKIFDLHFAAFKKYTDEDIPTAINKVDQNKQQSLLHRAVEKANIYCVKVLLENGGNPLAKAFSTQKTCFTIVHNVEGEQQNTVFNLLLAKTGEDKLKVDLSNLNSDQFQDKYGISKSLMFEHTQNQQTLTTAICQQTEPSNIGFKK